MATSGSSQYDLLDQLAEEFAERYRRGERPSVQEYIDRYPHLAEGIREILPAMVEVEQVERDRREPVETPATSTALPLQQIGDYRILREIGRGGMGIVYEAEQISLGRHVALKVLPAHTLLDPKRLHRFRREAMAAARLHHTNIVPVFGVGEQDSLHYYVMQFIQGLPLDEVLAELQRLRRLKASPMTEEAQASAPKPSARGSDVSVEAVAQALLTGPYTAGVGVPPSGGVRSASRTTLSKPPEGGTPTPVSESRIHLPGQSDHSTLSESGREYWHSVARIGIQVAEALAYATTQGILHRDIKPSNLLLDTQGTVWITDFGLAKVADSADLTNPGDLVGTFRYMASERFEGQADVRSDLYSLGLTLYELLTFQAAFQATDRNKLMDQVLHEEPPRPRKLNAEVPRDLETIVQKAMAKDPVHRYQTATELAADLKRFVEDRPIRARRVRVPERLWRWCRRNPVVAGLTAGLAALLLVAAVASTLAAVHFERAQKSEAEQRRQADAARQEAEANFAKARAAVDDYLTKVSESQLLNVPGLQPLRRDLLTSALTFYKDFLKQRGDDTGLRAALAAAQFRVGRIYDELGDREASRKAMQSARAVYEELSRAEPGDVEPRVGLARCHFYTGAHAKAIEGWEKLLDADPNNARYQKELADAYNALANQHRNNKDKAAALAAHQQALALRSTLVRNDPDHVQARRDLGQTLSSVADLLWVSQDSHGDDVAISDVLAMYHRFVEHTEAAFGRGSDRVQDGRELVVGYSKVARSERQLGHSSEALRWYRKAADLAKRLAQENPAIAHLQSEYFNSYRVLAAYQRELGQGEEAANTFRLASDVLERLPRQSADDLYNLACVLAQASVVLGEGRERPTPEDQAERRQLANQALDALRRALAAGFKALDRIQADRDLDVLRPRADFKELLAQAQRAEKAAPPAKATADAAVAKPKVEQAALANRLDLATSHYAIGRIQTELGQYEAAATSLAQALELRAALLRDDPANARRQADLALTRLALGRLEWRAGRHAAAVPKIRQALEALEAVASREPEDDLLNQQLANGLTNVAHLYARGFLWQEAVGYLAKAVQRMPTERYKSFCLAHLLVQTGDVEGYRRLCRDMLERFGNRRDPRSGPQAGQAALLLPDAVTDRELLTRLAEFGVQEAPASYRGTRRVVRGITAYRNGQFAAAVRGIEEGLNGNADIEFPVNGHFFLAMAHHQLGQAEAARTALDQGRAALRRCFPRPDHDELGEMWVGWAGCQISRREAETLIEGATTADPLEYLHRAKLYAQLGETDRADAEFAAAVAVRPNDPEVWITRGRIFAQLDLKERSVADFARAIELKPLQSDDHGAKGLIEGKAAEPKK
jgi:serine/threonine protein kinase/tetratricopeptide (TPR) repeat protein